MKSNRFIPFIISCLYLAGMVSPVKACGPYAPTIPTIHYLGHFPRLQSSMAAYERRENLELWQAITSRQIPIADIEEVVYRGSASHMRDLIYFIAEPSENKFILYLFNTDDREILQFLEIAKEIEACWKQRRSPWYYPKDRSMEQESYDFDELIEQCRAYRGKRLRDRYALQVTRALFASRQYAACMEYADSAFADIADHNLMKRMAQRYVAGCWHRLGNRLRADSLFAQAGDIWSIVESDPVRYMAKHNPNAPQLIDYIRTYDTDQDYLIKLLPLAAQIVKDRRVRHKGDWFFLMAYINKEYNHQPTRARAQIYQAMKQTFSTQELADRARAYKMKLDAQVGDRSNLFSDLKWLERKTSPCHMDANEWTRICRNVVYEDWVPQLWKEEDYSTAILLCSYADNLTHPRQRYTLWGIADKCYGDILLSLSCEEMRKSEFHYNRVDYRSFSFQLMGSLSSSQLTSVYEQMMNGSTAFYRFLRRKVRTDRDYYYELIGTLALREENYRRAELYLQQVGTHYLRTMNIYKEGYLSRDPFYAYPTRQYDARTVRREIETGATAKLNFARQMSVHQHTMSQGLTADERGLARLMYAIGRRNSFEECWALTQYWRGWVSRFDPFFDCYDDHSAKEVPYKLYDYTETEDQKATEALYKKEIEAALAMLTTDEARAKAHYILGHLATVVKRYGTTNTAHHIKTSCDNWRSWL